VGGCTCTCTHARASHTYTLGMHILAQLKRAHPPRRCTQHHIPTAALNITAQLFRTAPVNIVDLADLIIEQSAIGCVLKQVPAEPREQASDGKAASAGGAAAAASKGDDDDDEDDDDDDADDDGVVYAVSSVLSLKAHAKRDAVQSIVKWMSSNLDPDSKVSALTSTRAHRMHTALSLPRLSTHIPLFGSSTSILTTNVLFTTFIMHHVSCVTLCRRSSRRCSRATSGL
jgi:hypothetical protein